VTRRRRRIWSDITGATLQFSLEGNIFGFGPPKTKMRSRLPAPPVLPVDLEGSRHELSAWRQPEAIQPESTECLLKARFLSDASE
jgi:hypothetical protein